MDRYQALADALSARGVKAHVVTNHYGDPSTVSAYGPNGHYTLVSAIYSVRWGYACMFGAGEIPIVYSNYQEVANAVAKLVGVNP